MAAISESETARGGEAPVGQPAEGERRQGDHPLAGADDRAGDLHARGERQLRLLLVAPLAQQRVGPVEPDGGDLDGDLARLRCRLGDVVVERQDVERGPVVVDAPGLHVARS